MKNVLKRLVLGWLGIVTALPDPCTHFNHDDCHSDMIVRRDIAVIGGGSTGTYSAIRLRDFGKIWHDLDLVKNYFARFNIPLVKADLSFSGTTRYVDYRTGKEVKGYSYMQINFTSALARYTTQLVKYPYIDDGFDLPDPVPADLLLPFGDFVKKYALDDFVGFLFRFAQGLGDLLYQPTLYVFKNFGSDVIRDLQVGFLTTQRHNNHELYENAQAELGADALLSSHIIAVDRSAEDYAYIVSDTPSGIKLIQAKKIVFTIPPKLHNLRGFDLDTTERCLFAQFGSSGYYTGLLRNTGIPVNVTVDNVGADTLYNLPALPGIYGLSQTGVPGLISVKYGSARGLPDDQVMADIISKVKLLYPVSTPEFAVFSSHTPFELTVPASAISAGFYKKLYMLQGYRKTWYTGAAFHTHDSSLLWQFTEKLLPSIAA
ncbi:hypothetical protein V1520DRAFT_385657 [Lipomyces starkeyi]|uniref:Amine oxidase domain-containing protein n=1 Tax=Lipomyces starkeyi NRRL Y-11557 TaxID=675824 RepID=A0A1E3PX11_LIPST|nr:hypothetical protein LIPSTDRAFT_66199 [Lipomyces starkeyi NRRL Y-11557]